MEGPRGSERSDDPFDGFSLLSLLPRTVGAAPVPPPSSQAHEAESIRCFLKSAVGESTKDVVEQAKVIDKSHQCGVGVTEKDEFDILAEGKDRHQGRRPALGRKRAQFSLKPVASRDSIPVVDADSEIQHIEDPEEYFLAFEQLENANRELKKLRGDISTNPVQNDRKGTRQRRPGLLGKTASYKHHFSAMDAAPEACKVLQDLAPDNGSSSIRMSDDNLCCNAADQSITLQPMNTSDVLFDSRKKADNKEDAANTLLDNLLSSFKEVGEGEEEAMLRKSLHIKSIDVGKIDLPELHTVQLIDTKASNTSVMQNRSSIGQLTQTSTSQTRSPFAAISALYKRISLKSQVRSPYLVSPFNMDSDPSARKARRIVSPAIVSNGHNEISSPVRKLSIPHTGNETMNVDSSKRAEELTIGRNYVDKNITEQSQKIMDNGIKIHGPLEEVENDMHSVNLLSKDACPEVEHLTSNCQTKELMSTDLEGDAGHTSWRSDVNASLCNDMDDVIDPSPEVEHSTSACHENTMTKSLRCDDDTRLSHAHNMLQDKVNVMTENEQLAGLDCSTVSPCPSTPLPPTDGPSTVASTLSRENDEVHSSQIIQNETGKQKSNGTKQNEEKLKSNRQTRAGAASQIEAGKLKSLRTRQRKEKLKSRQSLAGAGLAWQSGVRRSTRIRSRPLEFWRGERFLYGRIHDSLATVIGVKYASPGKEESSKGKVLKVKSFVSGEYEDLVSKAAS